MLMRYGDEPFPRVDHSRLERVVCAGEVLNPPAWDWLQNTILDGPRSRSSITCGRPRPADRCSAIRTASSMLPIKPGSATIPLPGIDAAVVTPDGEPCGPNEKGIMVLRRPFPGLTPRCGASPSATAATTGRRSPASTTPAIRRTSTTTATSGSAAAPTRSSRSPATASAPSKSRARFCKHPAVAECGVIGRPDDTRGEVISAFVLLKHGHRAVSGAAAGAARHGPPRAGPGGGHRRAEFRVDAAEDAQRQDHAPRAQGGDPRSRSRATSRRSRTKDRSTRRVRPGSRCGMK